MRGRRAALVLFLAVVAGCGDDPATPTSASVKRAWIGEFSNPTDAGPLVFDLVQTGSAVAGEFVYRSTTAEDAWPLQVQGSIANNQLHLELDPGFAYVDTFVLHAEFRPDLSLIGTLSHSSTHIEADFVARPLARGNLQLDLTVSLPATVTALCFDDSTIWASTSGDDYIRLRTDGTIADTVVVLYEGAHWTSSALAFDGNHLWGFLPVTIMDPGGSSRNVSKMLEFTAAGEIVGDFMLSHRTTGLAFDGHRFWSLGYHPYRLYAFAAYATVQDSVELDAPDWVDLAFDGTHFWSHGWYMERLYEFDGNGRAVALYELPAAIDDPLTFPAGIAVEGTHLWTVATNPFDDISILHRFRRQ